MKYTLKELLLKIKLELEQVHDNSEFIPSGYGDIEYSKCEGCNICTCLLPEIDMQLKLLNNVEAIRK
jgi:Pyruvate/2-oxoacid:ferredoxin oxidoreductase delta subunit